MTEMTPAEAVFFAAVALPAADRSPYLAQACAGNDDLRRHVERSLRDAIAARGCSALIGCVVATLAT
jgi:hypothetical protein